MVLSFLFYFHIPQKEYKKRQMAARKSFLSRAESALTEEEEDTLKDLIYRLEMVLGMVSVKEVNNPDLWILHPGDDKVIVPVPVHFTRKERPPGKSQKFVPILEIVEMHQKYGSDLNDDDITLSARIVVVCCNRILTPLGRVVHHNNSGPKQPAISIKMDHQRNILIIDHFFLTILNESWECDSFASQIENLVYGFVPMVLR